MRYALLVYLGAGMHKIETLNSAVSNARAGMLLDSEASVCTNAADSMPVRSSSGLQDRATKDRQG